MDSAKQKKTIQKWLIRMARHETTTTTTERNQKKPAEQQLDSVPNYSQLLRSFGELSADLVDLGLCIMLGQHQQRRLRLRRRSYRRRLSDEQRGHQRQQAANFVEFRPAAPFGELSGAQNRPPTTTPTALMTTPASALAMATTKVSFLYLCGAKHYTMACA